MWDTTILTVKFLERNPPDIRLGHENRYNYILIDVAVTQDKDIEVSRHGRANERYTPSSSSSCRFCGWLFPGNILLRDFEINCYHR